jgi:hypothetical protein
VGLAAAAGGLAVIAAGVLGAVGPAVFPFWIVVFSPSLEPDFVLQLMAIRCICSGCSKKGQQMRGLARAPVGHWRARSRAVQRTRRRRPVGGHTPVGLAAAGGVWR